MKKMSALIAICLILGLTLAYAEPKRVIGEERQQAAAQKKQRKQGIKTAIPDYATIDQQIDAVKNMEDAKAILKNIAKAVVLLSDGE